MVPSAIDPGGSGPETGEVLFFDGGMRTTRAKSSSTLAGFIEFIVTDKIVGTAGEDARPTEAGTAGATVMGLVSSFGVPSASWRLQIRWVAPRGLLPATGSAEARSRIYDSRPNGGQGCALAAALSLRCGAIRTGLCQRRDAGRHWLEARQSLRAGRMQSHARRFSGGPR